MKKKISILSSLCLTAISTSLAGYVTSCSKGSKRIFKKDSYKEYFKFDDSALSDFKVTSATGTGNGGYWSVSRNNEIKEFTVLKKGFVEVKYTDTTQLNETARKPTGSISAYLNKGKGVPTYNTPLDYKFKNSSSGTSHSRTNNIDMYLGSVEVSLADDAINPQWDKNSLDKLDVTYSSEDEKKLDDAGVGIRFNLDSKIVIIDTTKELKEPLKFSFQVKNPQNQVAVDEEINLSTKPGIINLNKRYGLGEGMKFNIANNNFTYGKMSINYYEQYIQKDPTFSLTIECKNQVKQSFFTSAQVYQWIPSKKNTSGTDDDYLWSLNIVNTSDSLVSWNSDYGYVPSPKLQQKGVYISLQLSMNVTGFKIYPTTLKPDPTADAPGPDDGYIDDKSTGDYSAISKVVVTNSPTSLIPDKTWPNYGEFGTAQDTKPFDKDHTVDGKADPAIKAAKEYSESHKQNYFNLFIGVPVDVTPDKADAEGNQIIFEFTADLPDDNPVIPDPDKPVSLHDDKKTVKSVYKLVTNIGIVPFVPPQY